MTQRSSLTEIALTARVTAFHEAGHAVAAYYRREAGVTSSVTIHPDDLARENAGEPEERHAIGFHFSRKTLRSVMPTGVDWPALGARLAVLLAGAEAERLAEGRPSPDVAGRMRDRSSGDPSETTGGGADYQAAFDLLHEAYGADEELERRRMADSIPEAERSEPAAVLLDRYAGPFLRVAMARVADRFEAAQLEARELLIGRWPAVEAVAAALLEHKRLSGDEVAELIEASAGG